MREINHIVVHCAGTPKGKHYDINDIRNWHINENGWSDVGYHYVILLDGTIELGRMLNVPGAHVKSNNKDSIGICYIGGRYGVDTRTPQQQESLNFLIGTLKRTFRKAEVLGHRDFSKDINNDGDITKEEWLKDCPCFDAKEEYLNL